MSNHSVFSELRGLTRSRRRYRLLAQQEPCGGSCGSREGRAHARRHAEYTGAGYADRLIRARQVNGKHWWYPATYA